MRYENNSIESFWNPILLCLFLVLCCFPCFFFVFFISLPNKVRKKDLKFMAHSYRLFSALASHLWMLMPFAPFLSSPSHLFYCLKMDSFWSSCSRIGWHGYYWIVLWAYCFSKLPSWIFWVWFYFFMFSLPLFFLDRSLFYVLSPSLLFG